MKVSRSSLLIFFNSILFISCIIGLLSNCITIFYSFCVAVVLDPSEDPTVMLPEADIVIVGRLLKVFTTTVPVSTIIFRPFSYAFSMIQLSSFETLLCRPCVERTIGSSI